MIEGEQLAVFLAVAEHRNFVRAADSLGIVQSVASKRLRKLENILGMRLLERGARSEIRLTRAGSLFVEEAQSALTELRRAQKVGENIARGTFGPLRIGYVFSAAMSGLLGKIVRTLREGCPDIVVTPRPLDTPTQLREIEAGEIDVAIVRPRAAWPAGTKVIGNFQEPVVLAMSGAIPLASRPTVEASNLHGQTLIIPQFREEFWLAEIVNRLRAAAGTNLTTRKTGDFITAAALAAVGEGIVVGPESLCRLKLDGLAFRELSGCNLTVDLAIIVRNEVPELLLQCIENSIGSITA